VVFIAPPRKRLTYRSFNIRRLIVMVMLPLRILSTAVFAEPAVAQVEEVSGLVHNLTVSFVL